MHDRDREGPFMTTAIAKLRSDVSHADVLRALKEYDRLGADSFFAKHGFSQTKTYEMIWDGKSYPPKAILGAAYELATNHRLKPGDFEGGKAGAVSVLTALGFKVRPRH
jgi:hypothetical protein